MTSLEAAASFAPKKPTLKEILSRKMEALAAPLASLREKHRKAKEADRFLTPTEALFRLKKSKIRVDGYEKMNETLKRRL